MGVTSTATIANTSIRAENGFLGAVQTTVMSKAASYIKQLKPKVRGPTKKMQTEVHLWPTRKRLTDQTTQPQLDRFCPRFCGSYRSYLMIALPLRKVGLSLLILDDNLHTYVSRFC